MKNRLILPKRLRRLLLAKPQSATRQRVARLPLLAVLAALPLSAGSAWAQPRYAPMSGSVDVPASLPSAQSISASDGYDLTERSPTSYYADFFRISVTAPRQLEITLDSGDELDTYLKLVNASGQVIAINDDDAQGTLGVGSRLVYDIDTPGIYYIVASTFNGLDTGNYTLNVSSTPGQGTFTPARPSMGNVSYVLEKDAPFSYQLAGGSGDLPGSALTYSRTSGSLPAGMTLGPNGLLSGTPTTLGVTTATIQVSNGSGTASGTLRIEIIDEYDAPVLAPIGNKTTTAGNELTFTATATDPTDDPLQFSLAAGTNAVPDGATIDPNTGVFSWTPTPAQEPGVYSFKVVVSDDGEPALTDEEEITITVGAQNIAPVNSVPGPQSTSEDNSLVFSAANGNALSISDADAGTGSLSVTLSVSNGTFAESSGSTWVLNGTVAQINAALATLTFVPTTNFNGTSTLTIETNDNGNVGVGGAQSDSDTVSITVSPVNDAPSFTPGSNVVADEDSGATSQAWASNISAGPANESGQTLSFAVTGNTNPALFSVAPAIASDGTLTFTPAPNASGSASVTVQLSDNGGTANGGSDTSGMVTFTITVNTVNDAPQANNNLYSTAFGKALTVNAASGILANDSDVEGDALSALLEAGPAHGTLVLNADGSFTYTPDAGYFGADSFTYRATDGQSANSTSNIATVTINVAANIAPVAVNDSRSTSEDTFVDINVVGNDTDADGGTLRVAQGSIAGVKGGTAELQSDGKTIRFTPSANANDGNTSGGFGFTYRVSDGTDTSLNTATVTITVSAVNDAPVVNGVTLSTLSPKTRDVLTASYGASDVDGDELTPTYVWYNGSTEVQRGASNTLNLATAGFGDKGDEITVAVSVSDGTTSSELKSSEAATVINTAPFIGSVTLAPLAPLTSDDIVASVNGAGDDDNDGLTYSYVWKKGEEIIQGQSGATLPASATENGDQITVTVTANDGSDDSLPVQSSAVTVQNLAPTVESLSPQGESDKVGAKRTFTMTVSDGNGAGDIKEAWLLVNTRLNWAEGATLIYVPSAGAPTSGLLYLRRGDAFPAPIQIGEGAVAGAVLDNGAVRVVGSEVEVTASGDSLTLSIPATIRDGLIGQNTLFTRVTDRSDATDSAAQASDNGYRSFGAYTVTPQFSSATNSAPILSALSPRLANTRIPATGGQLQTFVFYAKDDNGIGDMESLWFMVGKQLSWSKSATLVYQPRTRRLFLRSDDGSAFVGGGQIGSAGTIENSKVKVELSKVQVLIYPDGKSMGLRLLLEPKSGLLGQNTVWLRAQDLSGATAAGGDAQGFVPSGVWNVVQGSSANGATALSGGGS